MCKCDDLDSSTYLLIAAANKAVRRAMVRLKFVAMMNRATSFQVVVVAFVASLMASVVPPVSSLA